MTFEFSHRNLHGRDAVIQRLCEILPGALSWSILLGILALSCWDPLLAAVLIIAFDLHWLLRMLYMTGFLSLSYARLAIERDTDWMERIRELDTGRSFGDEATPLDAPPGIQRRLSRWLHMNNLQTLYEHHHALPRSESLYHLVIVPIAKEHRDVVEPGIARLARQPFPPSRILVVLALEAWAPEPIKAEVLAVQQAYRHQFLDLLVVEHPDGLPGEARVKGANATYAAKAAAEHFTDRGIPFEHVIASCFDADTVVSPAYFACLTYSFMITPDRTRASFQPIPVYHNNLWDVPGFARVLDIGSSFFQLVEATNPSTLVTFSSHSMSFKALVDVGYWPVDMISDDSAIFWKALIHFEGRYRVVPMYVTVSMDVVHAGSWWRTGISVYKQKRRWAWGVENFPIVVRGFLQVKTMRWLDRLKYLGKLLEGHVAWATWPFLLTIVGWLPALFANQQFSDSVLYYTTPRVTSVIFSLALVSLVTVIGLSCCLLPKGQARHPILRQVSHAFEWLMIPLVSLGFSAVPALDAQTRLMAGHYMEFWVAEKTRGVRARASRAVERGAGVVPEG